MLSIFAIDPEICLNFEWFRYCVEHCHPSKGRAIADLPPGEWCRKALEKIEFCIRDRNLGPVMGQSLKHRLNKTRDRLVHRPGMNWDYLEPSWLRNTETEHRREPFAAIVSPDYPGADDSGRKYHPSVLNEEIEAWNTRSGTDITRSPEAFAQAILPLLRVASEIHILDTHFKVDDNSLHTRNYQRILRDLAAQRGDFPLLTIHCCPSADIDPAYFEREFRRIYEGLLPAGKSVICVLWQADSIMERGAHPFHNRFVLTQHWGVMVGYGTDSAGVATEAPDTLQFIDQGVLQEKLRQSQKRKYPLISERTTITITGR